MSQCLGEHKGVNHNRVKQVPRQTQSPTRKPFSEERRVPKVFVEIGADRMRLGLKRAIVQFQPQRLCVRSKPCTLHKSPPNFASPHVTMEPPCFTAAMAKRLPITCSTPSIFPDDLWWFNRERPCTVPASISRCGSRGCAWPVRPPRRSHFHHRSHSSCGLTRVCCVDSHKCTNMWCIG